jgi:hypothetical protein
VARKIDEIAGGGENTFGALRHLQAGVGECDLVRPSFDQFGADLALKLAHLHRTAPAD